MEASKALGNRYALVILVSLLQEIHSRFLTTDYVDPGIAETTKKGLEALWTRVRQPEVLSKVVKSMLIGHANKLNTDLKHFVADLVIHSTKPSILPQTTLSPTKDEPKRVLSLVASEALAAFNNLSKEARKLRIHTEESVRDKRERKRERERERERESERELCVRENLFYLYPDSPVCE